MFTDLIKEDLSNISKSVEVNEPLNHWVWYEDNGRFYFLEKNSSRKRYGILKKCVVCSREFCMRENAPQNSCSRKCHFLLREKEKIKLNCENCNAEIFKLKSKMKSKSGLYFCGKKCKDIAQLIEGVESIHPKHYNEGIASYSERAFRFYGEKCRDCNVIFRPLLAVHHIDGDRNNGNMDNLEVLCQNHHMLRHMYYDENKQCWVFNSKKLTPRDELDSIIGRLAQR